jgi:hypothetical protein
MLLLLNACSSTGVDMEAERKALAERFFRGVYGGNPSVVEDLAGDEIVSSYPIFEKLFNTPAIRGRKAVKDFAIGFSQRWTNTKFIIHEAVAEKDRVVLVWGFQARNVGTGPQGKPPTNQEQSWGGITLFCFDEANKIVAEIGEESAPGPIERLACPVPIDEAAEVSERFTYVAQVKAGGDVDGQILFSQGIEGDLHIHGNFNEGKLSYEGWIR